jgi:hypothetical protein
MSGANGWRSRSLNTLGWGFWWYLRVYIFGFFLLALAFGILILFRGYLAAAGRLDLNDLSISAFDDIFRDDSSSWQVSLVDDSSRLLEHDIGTFFVPVPISISDTDALDLIRNWDLELFPWGFRISSSWEHWVSSFWRSSKISWNQNFNLALLFLGVHKL